VFPESRRDGSAVRGRAASVELPFALHPELLLEVEAIPVARLHGGGISRVWPERDRARRESEARDEDYRES